MNDDIGISLDWYFLNIIRMGETYSHLSYKQQKMCGYRQGTLTGWEG
jgi:hypothetical protein